MKKAFLLVDCAILAALTMTAQPRISENDKACAAELVSKMTLEEKCLLIAGQVDGFHTAAIERLGIPSVRMADGPQGVRNKTRSTYYPCGISLAASWNKDIALKVGESIGCDAKARGVKIMLCPGVNIYRSALCGRNFEYYGEDPYLASETAVNYILGIQSQNVMATVKHFALNNEEYDRHFVSSIADERTMNEIYFPAFRNAIQKADVAAVMTSYNLVNGLHAAESAELIGNLRNWGFDGIVMSDWTSTYTPMGCLMSGLDLEMPRAHQLKYAKIAPLVETGIISESVIDQKCIHILSTFSAYGCLDGPHKDDSIPEDYEFSRKNAYAAALEGPVLLKNNGILPLKKGTVVVMGPNCDMVAFGGGSGRMDPIEGRAIPILQAMQELGKGYKVIPMDWHNIDEAVVCKATAVIFAAGFHENTETENSDREYSMPDGQDEVIAALCDMTPNVIVVSNSGGEFETGPWLDKANAVLLAWYGGQAGGPALAALISGRETPSGKLPFTWWGSCGKNPLMSYYYPVKDTTINKRLRFHDWVEYREGVFVGYRGEKHFGVEPQFPFGYGLSYTQFAYSGLEVVPAGDGFDVSFTIANTGKAKGAEIAQVYVAPVKPSVVRPEQELKGYGKISLAPGMKGRVTVHLGPEAFQYYDVSIHDWKSDPGAYRILVGSSSHDIRLTGEINL